jgi:signal transduction histidine kinase
VLLAAAGAWGLHTLRVRDLRLKNAVLEERATLSQEIHDHISQIMTGIGLQLDAATQSLAAGSSSAGSYLDRANGLTRRGIEETRTMLRNLRQGVRAIESGDTSLDEALVERVAPLIEGTDVRLQARTEGTPFPLAPEAKHEILQVGHEAVTNALRHGEARHIDIVVTFERKGVRLVVENDGRGFEPAAVGGNASEGLGLTGMADRVARLRGTFDVRRRPAGGTMVTAFLPRNRRVRA